MFCGSASSFRSRLLPALGVAFAALAAALIVGCRGGAPEWKERPANVVVILVDTLRADRLTPYGYGRDTSPAIERWLVEPGTVVETAYAPASWTLPSMVGLMTGRLPGEFAGEELGAFGIPATVPTLAERMAELGYETAAFYGNPTLHEGNGFARGFETFYTPPLEIASLALDATDLNRRVLPWLAEHQHRPFFLWVHYLDPHDPYQNPDMPGGRSPWFPDYDGALTGASVHGVYGGSVELADPETDTAYLSALYDGEVRYVDRHVGELLSALDPEVLADTLVVLTSDHGEELGDHGGWKHGEGLYDEQIRVPLIWRWDGGIPAGSRLAGTVRLTDVPATLVAAAGGEAEPAWDGTDLLPALRGETPLPRRPAYARHFGRGPLRAAAMLGGTKLVLFNRQAPFAPRDSLEEHLWRRDVERLERVEVYDVRQDPGERHNLAAAGEVPAPLARVIRHHLDRELPGLRLQVAAGEGGGRVRGRAVFESPPEGWQPVFLGPGDEVELHGDAAGGGELVFDIGREPFAKGLRIEEETGALLALEVTLDGVPVAAGRLRVGGATYRGGRVEPAALVASGGPAGEEAVVVEIWRQPPPAVVTARDEETTRRLKALGYL